MKNNYHGAIKVSHVISDVNFHPFMQNFAETSLSHQVYSVHNLIPKLNMKNSISFIFVLSL